VLGGKTSFDELKPFSGVQVAFEVLTDAEARRAAQEIGNVLGCAGWKITSTVPNSELYAGYFDGVNIWYEVPGMPHSWPMGPAEKSEMDSRERCRGAAEALNVYLISKG
jgi:hypothetical protein